MTHPTALADRLNAAAQEFDHNGFVVIPGALSPSQLVRLNTAFDRYYTEFPEEWAHFSESREQLEAAFGGTGLLVDTPRGTRVVLAG